MFFSQVINFGVRVFVIYILLFSISFSANAQSAQCDCDGSKPDTVFNLSNKKSFLLCNGKKDTLTLEGQVTFSSFTLSVCGMRDEFDFSDGVHSYQVRTRKDTLFVEQIGNLPVGKDFEFLKVAWKIERFFFQNNKLVRTISPNPDIRKYTPAEIKAVINKYESATLINAKETEDLFYQLFVATISGDEKASRYFYQFQDKFGTLNGTDAEDYNELCIVVRLYHNH